MKKNRVRTNQYIKAPKVRVIFDNKNLGVMPTQEALKLAKLKQLDLVEISAHTKPPVCKIIDYGKFKYEQSKGKNWGHKVKIHEIKFGVNIDPHDCSIKIKCINKFLIKGDKVKILIMFRGRQNEHKELGYELAKDIITQLSKLSSIKNTQIKGQGKNIIFYVESADSKE